MNSSQRIAISRYAAAYDATSTSIEQAQQYAQELTAATQILSGVSVSLQNPRLLIEQKKLILNETLKDFPHALSFIHVLLDAKRYALLPEICAQVNQLLDDRKGISRALVTSAKILSTAQQQATQRALSTRYGKLIQATFQVDSSLLGGLTSLCEGELIDGSIKMRLKKLRQEISQ